MTKTTTQISPYRRGANNGLLMGIWLTVTCAALSQMIYVDAEGRGAMFTLLGVGMALLVPVILFLLMLRTWRSEGGRSSLSLLWTEGIMTFVFGAIIAVMGGYLYMRVIQPSYLTDLYGWMLDSMQRAAAAASGPEAEQYRNLAHNFRELMEVGEVPDALSLLINSVWFIIFSGSILSVVLASGFVMHRRLVGPKKSQSYE